MTLLNRRNAKFLTLRIAVAATAATFALSCTDDSVGPTSVSEDASKNAATSEDRQARTLGPRRPVPPNNRNLPSVLARAWGGEHIGLELDSNRGRVELDCAHGTIEEPIRPGADGSFSARGTFTFEHGGPISDSEVADTRPARYEGMVKGDEMALTILVDGQSLPFRFTLRRDEFPRVVKCL